MLSGCMMAQIELLLIKEISEKIGRSKTWLYERSKTFDLGRKKTGTGKVYYDLEKCIKCFEEIEATKEKIIERKYDCVSYNQCLNKAARKDIEFDCDVCKKYVKNIERDFLYGYFK